MSAIQPIDVATPNRAMQAPAGTGPAVVESGHPFAEMMRSAVSPTRTVQSASYPSGTSVSSRAQSSRSNISTGTHSKGTDASISASFRQGQNRNPSTYVPNQDGQSVDPSPDLSSSSTVMDGGASSPGEGQAPSPIGANAIAGQSSAVTQPRALLDTADAERSNAKDGRKQASSAKGAIAKRSDGISASSVIATSPSIIASSVPVMGAILPGEKASMVEPAESTAASGATQKRQSIVSPTTPRDPSVSNAAAAPGFATGAPPKDGAADEANAATTSDMYPSGGCAQDSGGGQVAAAAHGNSGHAFMNGSETSAADGGSSSTAGSNGIGNPGANGNDAVRSGVDGTSTSLHKGDALKSGSSTAATPSLATTAQNSAGAHAGGGDAGLALHDSSSLVSVASHSGAGGIFSPSAAGSATARATTSDAFTALDSAASGERGVLLHAAPHQVTVGVSDPSLGWVEVRAERVSGQIAAALTTSSTASHAALTSVLPTMTTYLQEHHAGVVQQVQVESSLTGGQAGTSSQGQSPSQSDARTSPDNSPLANSASNTWNAAPAGRAAIPTSQGTNFFNHGHSFSIRA